MSDRVRTVDMSDPAVVLDCYRKLNVAYKELKAENEKLRAALKLFQPYSIPKNAADTDDLPVLIGDLRFAAAALKEAGDE